MRQFLIFIAVLLFALAGVDGPGAAGVSAFGHPHAAAAKKHCKIVKKHGHKKKVCTTAKKPSPTPTTTSTNTPTPTVTPTLTPTVMPTSTPTVMPTSTPTAASTPRSFTIQTLVGTLDIADVQLVDRWPPFCPPPPCPVMVAPGKQLLAISLAKPDQSNFSDDELGQVFGESVGAHVTAADGSDWGVSPDAGWWSGMIHVSFEVPATAHGFKLLWPGNAPVDLEK
jgi:hypothetical protein